jgi:signal transduction histidine kinase/DNA-binding response OmpR family regulator
LEKQYIYSKSYKPEISKNLIPQAFFLDCAKPKSPLIKIKYYPYLFLLSILFLNSGEILSKETNVINQIIWLSIVKEIEVSKTPISYDFISEIIQKSYPNDSETQYESFNYLMRKFEDRFDINGAIFTSNQMARIAKGMNQPLLEAAAYRHLSRFHEAVGVYELSTLYMDKVIKIYEDQGIISGILYSKFLKNYGSLRFKKEEEVLPELRSILQESKSLGDERLTNKLHLLLLEVELEAKNFDLAEGHLEIVEQIPLKDSSESAKYNLLTVASRAKSEIAVSRKQYDLARTHFEHTLELCSISSGLWFEIFTLQSLAKLEIEVNNLSKAKVLLAEAETKARALNLNELLASNFDLQFQIAELENEQEEALYYLKKKIESKAEFESKSNNFSWENYQLKAEKDKLSVEKSNQELELNLNNSKLQNTLILFAMALLIGVFLIIIIYHLFKRKKELEIKNRESLENQKKLQSLTIAKSNFYANINHEIRTPLTLILGPLQTLIKNNNLDKNQLKLLKTAHTSSKQLQILVNNVLDLKKAEEGKNTISQNRIDLLKFFRNHLNQFEHWAEEKNIEFHYELGIPKDTYVVLDSEKYRQIIFNLLANAFKFTSETGKVSVSVDFKSSICTFCVKDSGIGIAEEEKPLIFDRFYQAAQNKELPGTGIGLAICQEYTNSLKGKLSFESKLGKGTTFSLAIPLKIAPIEELTPEINLVDNLENASMLKGFNIQQNPLENNPQLKERSPFKILIVEDHQGLNEYLVNMLSDHYSVEATSNGLQALEYLQSSFPENLPNLIISDLMMPKMDGYELLNKLKSDQNYYKIPVIILTAKAGKDEKLQMLRIGVDDYMTKPFDEEELFLRIKNLLKTQELRNNQVEIEPNVQLEKCLNSEVDMEWLKRIEDFVLKHMSKKSFSISFMASEFAMSDSTLLRQLKKLTGLSPSQYLQEVRLTEARKLLENRTYTSISKIANLIGYNDHRSFSRSFKNRFGKSPTDLL